MTNRIVVGFKNTETSLHVLRWAIKHAIRTHRHLSVIHAASIPIVVRNGPTRAVASTMGDPIWATVHSIVQSVGPPPNTNTFVEGGHPADVIAKHTDEDDLIALGPPGSRWPRRSKTQSRLKKLGRLVCVISPGTCDPGMHMTWGNPPRAQNDSRPDNEADPLLEASFSSRPIALADPASPLWCGIGSKGRS